MEDASHYPSNSSPKSHTANTEHVPPPAYLQTSIEFYRAVFDHIPDMMVVLAVISQTEFRLVAVNRTVHRILGVIPDEIGKEPKELFPPHQAEVIVQRLQECLDTGATLEEEEQVNAPVGQRWLERIYIPIRDAQNTITHIMVLLRDITARKQREQEEQAQQEARISQQAATLAELSTPLLTISEDTVVMPLIGMIDSQRAERMMETLLEGIVANSASCVILDITGVPVVDTYVAGILMNMAKAVRLLGATIILTGVRPEIAQTIVGLGVNLGDIITRSTLRDGINYALHN